MTKGKKPKGEASTGEADQGIEEPDKDTPVTYGDLKNLLGGLPTVVRTQVYKFLGVELGPQEEEPSEERMREVLGGYPTFGEAIRDLRTRLEEAEKVSREDIVAELKRYIDEEVVPKLPAPKPKEGKAYDGSDLRQSLEGENGLIERVRKLEQRPAYDGEKKGKREDPEVREELRALREVLIDVVKEVYGGDSTGQRYLKLLEDRRKA